MRVCVYFVLYTNEHNPCGKQISCSLHEQVVVGSSSLARAYLCVSMPCSMHTHTLNRSSIEDNQSESGHEFVC